MTAADQSFPLRIPPRAFVEGACRLLTLRTKTAGFNPKKLFNFPNRKLPFRRSRNSLLPPLCFTPRHRVPLPCGVSLAFCRTPAALSSAFGRAAP